MTTPLIFPKRLAAYTAILFVAACAAVVILALREGLPPAPAATSFALVVFFSSHRRVYFANGVHVSPAFMAEMAAIIVFMHSNSLADVVLIGMLSALYIPNLTPSTWGWFPFNAGLNGLGMLAAGAVYSQLPSQFRDTMPKAIVVTCRSRSRSVLVTGPSRFFLIRRNWSRRARRVPSPIRSSFGQIVPFALLGACSAALPLARTTVMLLIIVPILIAREMLPRTCGSRNRTTKPLGCLSTRSRQRTATRPGHSERVAEYARYIGEELNFMPARLERLRFAALMHDIGKLVVSQSAAQQAGPADAGRVRAGAGAREGQRADAEPHRLPSSDRGRLAQ